MINFKNKFLKILEVYVKTSFHFYLKPKRKIFYDLFHVYFLIRTFLNVCFHLISNIVTVNSYLTKLNINEDIIQNLNTKLKLEKL